MLFFEPLDWAVHPPKMISDLLIVSILVTSDQSDWQNVRDWRPAFGFLLGGSLNWKLQSSYSNIHIYDYIDSHIYKKCMCFENYTDLNKRSNNIKSCWYKLLAYRTEGLLWIPPNSMCLSEVRGCPAKTAGDSCGSWLAMPCRAIYDGDMVVYGRLMMGLMNYPKLDVKGLLYRFCFPLCNTHKYYIFLEPRHCCKLAAKHVLWSWLVFF